MPTEVEVGISTEIALGTLTLLMTNLEVHTAVVPSTGQYSGEELRILESGDGGGASRTGPTRHGNMKTHDCTHP